MWIIYNNEINAKTGFRPTLGAIKLNDLRALSSPSETEFGPKLHFRNFNLHGDVEDVEIIEMCVCFNG